MFPLALGIEELVAPYLTTERYVESASNMIKLVLTILSLLVAIFVPSFSYLWYVLWCFLLSHALLSVPSWV